MGPLHTVNKSPFSSTALESCLAHATPDAAILLIEDGVYGVLAAAPSPTAALTAAAARGAVYALGPDLLARGLGGSPLLAGTQVVDYAGFVDLTTARPSVVAWL
jgi:tRNA 2-thiouridine synthesizing protein B